MTVFDLYVSNAGSDSNPGTIAEPLATLREVDTRIPLELDGDSYNVHLRNETYPLPTRDYWLRARTYQPGCKLTILADESWDPTVYTVAVSGAAAAGTDANKVVTTGLTADAQRGRTLRMTSGAAAGQYRRINGNTTTDLLLDEPLSPAAAPDDTFEVLTLNVAVNAPAASQGTESYLVADNQNAVVNGHEAVAYAFPAITSGLVMRGFKLTSSVGSCTFGGGALYWLGVDAVGNFVIKAGGQWFGGITGDDPLLKGWGAAFFNSGAAPAIYNAQFNGYAHVLQDGIYVDPDSSAHMLGGFFHRLYLSVRGYLQTYGSDATPLLISPGGASVAIHIGLPRAVIELISGAKVQGGGAGIIVRGGAVLFLGSTITGGTVAGNAVDVAGASKVVCVGAPNFGGAGNDWVVLGAQAFNKAALAAVGSSVVGTDTSVAVRSG